MKVRATNEYTQEQMTEMKLQPFTVRKCFSTGEFLAFMKNMESDCRKSMIGREQLCTPTENAITTYTPLWTLMNTTSIYLNPFAETGVFILHYKQVTKDNETKNMTIQNYTELQPFVDSELNENIMRDGYLNNMVNIDGLDLDRLARIIIPHYLIAKWDHEDETMTHEQRMSRIPHRALNALLEWTEIHAPFYPNMICRGVDIPDGDRKIPTFYLSPQVFYWILEEMTPINQQDTGDVFLPRGPQFIYPTKNRFGLGPDQKIYVCIDREKDVLHHYVRYILMEKAADSNDYYPIHMSSMTPSQLYGCIANMDAKIMSDIDFQTKWHDITNMVYPRFYNLLCEYVRDHFETIELAKGPYDIFVLK